MGPDVGNVARWAFNSIAASQGKKAKDKCGQRMHTVKAKDTCYVADWDR